MFSAGWATAERLSGTVTFLFTDIEGSTGLLKRLGRDQYRELLTRHQVLLREAFAANRGEEIDTQGDSFFVAFRSASDAVAAAVAIQRVIADHEWPDGVDLGVRIGIHSGEAAAAGERYVGFSVHRAARIGAIGNGGQVLLSSSTRELVEDDLPPGVFLRDLGSYRLKDVDRPERISQVVAEGLRVEFPPLRGAEEVKQAPLRRRSLLLAALAGVIAAAVAIPVFALGGGSGETSLAGVGADSVGAIDSESGRIAASVPVGSSPGSVATDKGSLWVTNTGDDSVSRIDLEDEHARADHSSRGQQSGRDRDRRRLRVGRQHRRRDGLEDRPSRERRQRRSRRHVSGRERPDRDRLRRRTALGRELDRPDGDGVRARLAHAADTRSACPTVPTRSPTASASSGS